MKNKKIYILILIVLILIFIILNFYKSKSIFEDIIIFSLWEDNKLEKEYEISLQNNVEIDISSTINNIYKKIAPGSKGSFVIKFKRSKDCEFKINVTEKSSKPQNLVFILDNKKYYSIKQMENEINRKFIESEKITIEWEWIYYIDEIHDIKDTEDGKNANKYIFVIEALVEERGNNEI